MSDYVDINPNSVTPTEIEDPYKYIRGEERKLTLFQRIRRNIRKYIKDEIEFWKSMKEYFISLGTVFGSILLIIGTITLVINQIEYESSIVDEQTIIKTNEVDENIEEDNSENYSETDNNSRTSFVPRVETGAVDITNTGENKRKNMGSKNFEYR